MLPSYHKLSKQQLQKRADQAWQLLSPCRLCPRQCQVDRLKGEFGFCQVGSQPLISSYHPHFGEEKVLVGSGGSGAIFFASCNLACLFCQNYEISHWRIGQELQIKELAEMMLKLQRHSCHNINLVSPTIWLPAILSALILARDQGLKIPLVYNSGGYDAVDSLKLLKDIVDIYMPDLKYSDSKMAKRYSLVDNYFEVAKVAIKQMYQQVGDLQIGADGLAQKGVLVRHLILPNQLAGSQKVIKFLSSLSKNTYLNLMDQYYPAFKAFSLTELNRPITSAEYQQALDLAKAAGLHRFA